MPTINDSIHPAAAYAPADGLWIITTHFNSAGFASKLQNLETFTRSILDSGLKLLIVECAFGDQPFELESAAHVHQVRARDVMWQKERLLNLALARLPPACTKVAWLDGDVLFENPDWAVETSRLLEHAAAVQPFATAIRLPRGARSSTADCIPRACFAAVRSADPRRAALAPYNYHGSTGFGWAARREAIQACGFYDALVIGGGDHAMAHAMSGDWRSPCLRSNPNETQSDHLMEWSARCFAAFQGRIASVPGNLLHLWHGGMADRDYSSRQGRLSDFAFDPGRDLRIGPEGAWEWASSKPSMHAAVAAYFPLRREDGEAHPSLAIPTQSSDPVS